MEKDKVVLAYSGGLDTSITIPWLKENYDLDVIAVCVNVGQEDDMKAVKQKAIESGAIKTYVCEETENFVKDYVYKSIKANALYEGRYLLGTALARPLIAKKLVEIAHKESAKYICHGCTGKGNDQVRFEMGIAYFDPSIKIIAPWRIWDISSREDAIDYANKKNIKIDCTKKKIYSRDQNIFHISHEGGDLEDLERAHDGDNLYLMTKTLENASDAAEYLELEFNKGEAVSLNGKNMKPFEILKELNKLGNEHAIGILDMLEDRLVGMKSRGVYETPGGTILMQAHIILESLTLDKNTINMKNVLSLEYANIIYNGLWFSQLKESLDAFFDKTQEFVTGTVKLKLYKGNILPCSIKSDYALYDKKISSFGKSELYNHHDAQGFINLFSLPTKINSMMLKKNNLI